MTTPSSIITIIGKQIQKIQSDIDKNIAPTKLYYLFSKRAIDFFGEKQFITRPTTDDDYKMMQQLLLEETDRSSHDEEELAFWKYPQFKRYEPKQPASNQNFYPFDISCFDFLMPAGEPTKSRIQWPIIERRLARAPGQGFKVVDPDLHVETHKLGHLSHTSSFADQLFFLQTTSQKRGQAD